MNESGQAGEPEQERALKGHIREEHPWSGADLEALSAASGASGRKAAEQSVCVWRWRVLLQGPKLRKVSHYKIPITTRAVGGVKPD